MELDAWYRPGASQDAGRRGVITWASSQGSLCLGELAGAVRQGVNYVGSHGLNLQASRSLPLLPQESILQVEPIHCAVSYPARVVDTPACTQGHSWCTLTPKPSWCGAGGMARAAG